MRLTPAQQQRLDHDGYLFFPGLFTPEETRKLTDAVPALYSRREDYNVREKGSDAVRTNFAAHMYNDLIRQLVTRAGSMILFHSCLVHASSSNLSPFNRVSVYLSLCAVSNHIRRHKRPEYIAQRDFTPITCLPNDCLLKDYPVDLPWKNGLPASALQTSIDELKLAA